ncbi:Alcohol acetyltransferase [Sulfidibacter corallicola]|uniref:Phthiocerol/phthiodiolone dimycocerosyl transferase n=1 Tax=Sulfidibacter corallicola TaxID=2818388 RepID=A0A8A4TH12_SULCO|nr:hypothetical protein [Sulfidibacter corallicola]QTD48018.1 hypothetical protein J3U87_20740 [Sulfidibacter corallicola]
MSKEFKAGFWPTTCKIYQDRFRGAGNILTVFRASGPLTLDLLKRSAAVLMLRHPMCRANLEELNKRYYFFNIDEAFSQMSSWSEQRDLVPIREVSREDDAHFERLAERDFAENFPDDARFLWRLTFIRDPDDRDHQFLHVMSHAVSDALSTATFCKQLLELAAPLAERDGGDTPIQTLASDLVGEAFAFRPPVETMIKKPELDASSTSAAVAEEALGIWRSEGDAPLEERFTYNIYEVVEEPLLRRLHQQAKSHGATIHAGLTAAFLTASAAKFGLNGTVPFSTPVNLRRHCEPEVGPEDFGCYVTVEQTHFDASGKMSFWELAKDCNKILKEKIQVSASAGFLPVRFNRSFIQEKITNELGELNEDRRCPGGPGLSNLGLLPFEATFGPFSLNELYFTNSQVNGYYPVFLSVLTFSGRAFCVFSCAYPLLSKETLRQIADETLKLVGKHA